MAGDGTASPTHSQSSRSSGGGSYGMSELLLPDGGRAKGFAGLLAHSKALLEAAKEQVWNNSTQASVCGDVCS